MTRIPKIPHFLSLFVMLSLMAFASMGCGSDTRAESHENVDAEAQNEQPEEGEASSPSDSEEIKTVSSNSDFEIQTIEFKGQYETLKVPYVVSETRSEIATLINDLFQNRYFEGTITPDDYEEVMKMTVAYDEEHFNGWTSMTYENPTITDRYLYFEFSAEYLGAYPTFSSNTYMFDLESGLPVDAPSFFTLEGWFDFLNDQWLDACFALLPEANDCGGGLEEDECYNECYTIEQFTLGQDNTLSLHQTECFPHVARACNPYLEKKYTLSKIETYLSDYGKYLLGLSDKEEHIIPQNYFLVGEMDGRIKIVMALQRSQGQSNEFEGYYYYQNVKENIPLKGTLSGEKLSLSEYIDGKYNGAFSLSWEESKYFTNGTWENADGSKSLKVELRSIYEYDTRSLL